MRTFVLILLFIAVPLAGGSLKPERESEFWINSGADLRFISTVINEKVCASGEVYFNSCRKALLVGAKMQKAAAQDDLKALEAARFPGAFPFDRVLARLLEMKNGPSTEWLVGRMVNAQLKYFDPYAQVIPDAYSEHLLNGDNKTYYGTGIEGEANGAGLFIYQVFPGSAAAHAGLQVHDQIISLNGEKIDSLNKAHMAAPRLNGEPGSKIVLDILREGRLLRRTLQVAPVVVPENPAAEFSVDGKRFLQIRIRSFSRGICMALNARIGQAIASDRRPLAGLILDLRHNRGGIVEESECVVRLFAATKTVVKREALNFTFPDALDFQSELPAAKSATPTLYPKIKVAVLINSKSASASEIAAGAFQDLGRAWIVGERSYGKGTTQLLHNLGDFPGLRVSKTVSRYIRPSGLSVHGLGVIPNFEATLRAGAAASERRAVREEDVVSHFKLAAGERWSENRTQEVGEIRDCIEREDMMLRTEPVVRERLGHHDNQSATALAVLNCR